MSNQLATSGPRDAKSDNKSKERIAVDPFRLTPFAALLQVFPWAVLTCLILWRMTLRRGVPPLGLRWILLSLLLWLTASAVFLLLQDVLGATGRNENLLILGGVLAGYGLTDLCVKVFLRRSGSR